MYQIYTLIDPRDNLIHYVGISKNALVRFQQHIRKDHNRVKSAWIRELKEAKLLPILNIIAENLTCEEAQEQERKLIQEYHASGLPLVNFTGIKRLHANMRLEDRNKWQRWPSPVTRVQIIHARIPTQIVKPTFEEYITAQEASEMTGISIEEVIALTQKKILKGFSVNKRKNWRDWRIDQESLKRYIEERESQDGK